MRKVHYRCTSAHREAYGRGLPGRRARLVPVSDLKNKLPREAFEGPDGVPFDDADFMRGLANEVRELLLSRLLGGERP